MRSIHFLFFGLFMCTLINAQPNQCVLLSGCCDGENEYFELMPTEEEDFSRSNPTAIYANQVPLVHYTGEVERYPLEMRVVSNQEVLSASIAYYDFATFSYLESDLFDDGLGFDEVAGDGTYTSRTSIVQSRDIRNSDIIYHYNLISGKVTLTYAGGSTEEFNLKLDGYTIDGDLVDLDTSNLEIKNIENFYYSENVVNCVLPQEYSFNIINYSYRDILNQFRDIWADFDDAYVVLTSLSETNAGNASFRSSANPFSKNILLVSNRGMTTAFPLNHEITHFWLYPSEFNLVSNHWRYIERPQSGFGYDCYNGVMTELYEEDGVVKYKVEEADNPHEYFYNDIELNLMGVLPVDSVDFPLNYFDRNSFSSTDCDSRAQTISDGTLLSLSKEDYIDFKATKDLEDVSDGLDLKFIFLTEERVTKEEHAMFEYLVLNYAEIFKRSTSDLVDLKTELYNPISTTTNNVDKEDNSVLIFPNPTDGSITIELQTEEEAHFAIYDVTGKLCKSAQVNNGRHNFNLTEMAAGIYVLQIDLGKGNFRSERIVKY